MVAILIQFVSWSLTIIEHVTCFQWLFVFLHLKIAQPVCTTPFCSVAHFSMFSCISVSTDDTFSAREGLPWTIVFSPYFALQLQQAWLALRAYICRIKFFLPRSPFSWWFSGWPASPQQSAFCAANVFITQRSVQQKLKPLVKRTGDSMSEKE